MPTNTGAIVASAMSVLRSLAVVATAIVTIAGLVSRHQWAELYALVQGETLVPAVGAAVALSLTAWGAWKRWQGHVAVQAVRGNGGS